MKIELKSLELTNFKGIKNKNIDFKYDTTISGDNATGKTTIFDAYCYLLWDKDSQNRSDFEIKTIGADGRAIPNIEHSVEGVFEIDEVNYTFKKVYKEIWTKKRGQTKADFTGHATDYYINDVPIKKKEYQDRIGSIITEDEFKLLSNPFYFNEVLKKEEKRKLLTELVEISDKLDISNENKDFERLELDKYTIDEIKAKYKSQAKKANEKLKEIPIRIDEIQKQIRQYNFDELEMQKNITLGSLKVITGELEPTNLTAQRIRQLTGELAQLEMQKSQIDINAQKDYRQKITDIDEKLSNTISVIDKIEKNKKQAEYDIKKHQEEVDAVEKKLLEKRSQWVEIKKKKYGGDNICPTCKQTLPNEQIQKIIEEFNEKKSEELEHIENQSQELIKVKNKSSSEIESLKMTLQNALQQEEKLKMIYDTLKDEKSQIKPADTSSKTADVQREIDRVKKELSDIGASSDEENEKKKLELQQKLDEINQQLASQKINQDIKQQIEKYELEEKELAKTYEEAQRYLYIVELYEKAYADAVTDKINSMFDTVKFKLFDEQINGGLIPTCEATIDSVPYSDLNSAGKINAGLDIMKTISTKLDKYVPVFVDNAESINDIKKMNTQMIKLQVSKEKELKIC